MSSLEELNKMIHEYASKLYNSNPSKEEDKLLKNH